MVAVIDRPERADAPLADTAVPLCVDMDGTLLRTDTLMEGFVRLLREKLLALASVPAQLMRGRAQFKAWLAHRTELEPQHLPYHEPFLAWLHEQRRRGRTLVLCTAANEGVARAVAQHVGVFSEVLASTEQHNLKGSAKAARLVARFGAGGFDYAGNDRADIECWSKARRAIVVSPTATVRRKLDSLRPDRVFAEPRSSRLRIWLRALRAHQWTKNALVLVPALVSHRVLEPNVLVSSMLAVLIFCACASGVYLLNDLMDLDSDRQHPSKRRRPLAAGDLPILHGLLGAGVLIIAALVGAFALLGPAFGSVLTIYLATTSAYSRSLKRSPIVDVQVLAGLYTLRVIAGAAAIAVMPSFWLLACSMFLFLSLAMAKRCSELLQLSAAGRDAPAGRGYTVHDLLLLEAGGIAAGFISVLVLAMYVRDGAEPLYSRPELLWLLCPLLLYWVCRIWLKTHRGQMHDDPIVFAITDRPSLLAALGVVLLCLAAL